MTHHDVYFGLVLGTVATCFVLVVAICAVALCDWLRGSKRNVTIVRGKAEGPTAFPKVTPVYLPKGYLDAAEKLSKEDRQP